MPGVSVPFDIFLWMHEFEAKTGRRPVGAVIHQREIRLKGRRRGGVTQIVNDFEMVAVDPGPMKGASYMTLGDWMFHPVTQDEIETVAARHSLER